MKFYEIIQNTQGIYTEPMEGKGCTLARSLRILGDPKVFSSANVKYSKYCLQISYTYVQTVPTPKYCFIIFKSEVSIL